MAQQKLSLWSALLININIILGAGVFINTVELAKRAENLSSFSYLLVGILLLPLMASIAALLQIYPDGGFYSFATPMLGSFAGFFSTWSYFVGKLASATIMIHTAMVLLCQLIPALAPIPLLTLDGIIVFLFMLLNMCNMKTGSKIQAGFLIGKLIPLLFVVCIGIVIFNPQTLSLPATGITEFASTIPLVLYAAIGFEATCSISRHINNPRRNGPMALFMSYAIVILLLFLYQFCFYGVLGSTLSSLNSYLQAFPTFIAHITPNHNLIGNLSSTMYICVALSALGGAYAIMYSNMWNLHTLATHGHVFFSDKLVQTNSENIPFLCVLAQGAIIMLYLAITHGNQIPLQQTGALGVAISYAISVVSLLLYGIKKKYPFSKLCIPLLALGSASTLIRACILNFLASGISPLQLFIGILATGCTMFVICNRNILSHT